MSGTYDRKTRTRNYTGQDLKALPHHGVVYSRPAFHESPKFQGPPINLHRYETQVLKYCIPYWCLHVERESITLEYSSHLESSLVQDQEKSFHTSPQWQMQALFKDKKFPFHGSEDLNIYAEEFEHNSFTTKNFRRVDGNYK